MVLQGTQDAQGKLMSVVLSSGGHPGADLLEVSKQGIAGEGLVAFAVVGAQMIAVHGQDKAAIHLAVFRVGQ